MRLHLCLCSLKYLISLKAGYITSPFQSFASTLPSLLFLARTAKVFWLGLRRLRCPLLEEQLLLVPFPCVVVFVGLEYWCSPLFLASVGTQKVIKMCLCFFLVDAFFICYRKRFCSLTSTFNLSFAVPVTSSLSSGVFVHCRAVAALSIAS